MINILKFPYTPKTCCWIHEPGAGQTLLAVSDVNSPTIRIYDGRVDGTPMYELDKLHRAPVHLIAYTSKYDCVISADEDGFVEYWQPTEPWGLPAVPGLWKYKSSTDLYQFKKTKSIPTCVTFSPNSSHFVTMSLPSRAVHVFNFLTGKLTRTYDESLTAAAEMQMAGTAVFTLENMDFGRRIAAERGLDASESGPGGALRTANAVWDESGNFIIYPTLLGIKGESSLLGQKTDSSGQHRYQQGVKSTWQRRDSAIPQCIALPRSASEEGHHYACDGCICQSALAGQSHSRPACLLYRLQEAAILRLWPK
jgi:peptidylprolyl isomerase domain and WD repeat-containing protein 1